MSKVSKIRQPEVSVAIIRTTAQVKGNTETEVAWDSGVFWDSGFKWDEILRNEKITIKSSIIKQQ